MHKPAFLPILPTHRPCTPPFRRAVHAIRACHQVDISVQTILPPPLTPSQLHKDAISLLRAARSEEPTELSILLCGDAQIRSLNLQYRGKDASTDVLSFPQCEHGDKGRVLGDVVISIDTAQRQRLAVPSFSLRDEVRVLLLHGFLHLLGFDHEGLVPDDYVQVS